MIGNSSWYKAKIIIFITYIISAIIFEQIYRKPLFEKSLKIESNLYSTTPEFFIKTFKFISKFGTQGALIPLLIIVLIFFPINISYTFASVIVLASSLMFISTIAAIFSGVDYLKGGKELFK